MNIELTINFLGFGACVVAAGFLFLRGSRLPGALLLAGFLLHLQSALYITYSDPAHMGQCWVEKSYYECLPLGYKISIHASQVGHYLLAAGVLVLAFRAGRARIPGS